MVSRAIRLLLIKIFPVYAATIAAWQFGGVARLYDAFLASCLNGMLPAMDSSGLIRGVDVSGGEWLIRILLHGKRVGLSLTAADITSNAALLVALFLSSPIRSVVRKWIIYFASATGALVIIHLITASLIVQFAFSTNPEVARELQYGPTATRFFLGYRDFYVQYGMYLFVLALWCPYFLLSLRGVTRRQT